MNRPSRLIACSLAVISLLGTKTSFAICRSCREAERLCGPRCLLAVCQKLGVASSLDELARLSDCDVRTGTSMYGLQKAAQAKGLRAVGMKMSIDELLQLSGVFVIGHFWSNHFVVVEHGADGALHIVDPPGEPVVTKKEDFAGYYSGFALLIAKDATSFPKVTPAGPDLRFDDYAFRLGVVNQGEQVTCSFKCRNLGTSDLVISKVDTSCGDCLVPLGGPQAIAPGGEGEIKALVTTAHQGRAVSKELFVTSNDPVSPTVHLQVTGYVRLPRLIYAPHAIVFGNPRRTDSVRSELYVPSDEEDPVRVRSASASTPYLSADLSPSTDPERPGYLISATLKPGAPVGPFKASVTIASDNPKQPVAEVPVTALIRGNVDLDHDSFFLGALNKGQERKAAVDVSTVASSPLRIDKIDNPLPYLSVDVKPKVEGKEYTLTATLKPDAPVGNIKGEVTIHTNDPDQPEIKVPVYAYVEGT